MFSGHETNAYIQEHTDLIAAIRKGDTINELKTVAESTLTAILGRMATYTGDEVSWEAALNSPENSYPAGLTLDSSLDTAPVPLPGQKRKPRAASRGN